MAVGLGEPEAHLFLSSFLQLAKKFHPDSNKDKSAKAKFVEIQEAYDVRCSPRSRSSY